MRRPLANGIWGGGAFSVLCVLFVAAAAYLHQYRFEAYYGLVQEDGALEWATFWGFFAAGIAAFAQWLRTPSMSAWRSLYLIGLGSGCLVIALEEISWGQRLFGYRPPDAFLTGNFQQELNLHNFADTATREASLLALFGGFGMLFPLAAHAPPLARWLAGRAVPVPPASIAPGFGIACALYIVYPWTSTGEWVELLGGLGFLVASLDPGTARPRSQGPIALCTVLCAGMLTPWLLHGSADPARIAIAERETAALAEDFASKRFRSRCGVHKRLYTFHREYGARGLERGAFAKLTADAQADSDTLARHARYLDPWNLPYWIRHRCSADRRQATVFVYSFGPNRRRDSSQSELRADDVGSYVNGAAGELTHRPRR